jgi:WD40 repeat protein
VLRTHQARVSALAFARDAPLLASGAADGSVAVWDLADAGRRIAFAMLEGAVTFLAFAASATALVAATGAGGVHGLRLERAASRATAR